MISAYACARFASEAEGPAPYLLASHARASDFETLHKARDARSCGQEVVQLDQPWTIRAGRFKGVPIIGDSVMEWTYWHERQTTKASRTQATDIALTLLPETLHVESQ